MTSSGNRRLERSIETLEERIKEVDRQLLDPAVYTDGPRCRKLQKKRAQLASELEPLEKDWHRRAEEA